MENQENITCKVVLVGESGVGKTSIINRYLNNTYNENQKSTFAPKFKNKVLNYPEYNKSISFDIWDTAGQEAYRSITKNFYVNAAIGVMVYDIRNRESFENIKKYWSQQLKDSGVQNIVLAIAGNKCDIFNEEEVSENEAREYAESIGAVFQLTSCKENIGIDELFKESGKRFLEANKLIAKEKKQKKENENLKIEGKNVANNGKTTKKKC
jgi:Ras-related protein Rab-22